MKRHPYLRAYLAGIAVPTAFLLVILTVFTASRHVWSSLAPFERVIVFPMALVPNLWGLWNVLYLWVRARRRWPLGAHGALLPFLLVPGAWLVSGLLGFTPPHVVTAALPYGFPVVVEVYYLAWKHLVGFLNELLGVSL